MSELKTIASKMRARYSINQDNSKPKKLRTGVFSLDLILKGGLTPNRSMLISGMETTFKSSLAKIMTSNAQKQGKRVLWADLDEDWDDRLALNVGINLNSLFLIHSETVENLIEIMREVKKRLEIDFLVVDSLANLRSEDNEKSHTHCMSDFLRFLVGLEDTTAILINQLRDKVGAPDHVYPYAKPGGVLQDLVGKTELRMVRGITQFEKENRNNGAISSEVRFVLVDNPSGKTGEEGTFRLWLKDHEGHREGEIDEVKTMQAYAERYGIDRDMDCTRLQEKLLEAIL